MDFYPPQYVGPSMFITEQAPYDPHRKYGYDGITAFTGGTCLPSKGGAEGLSSFGAMGPSLATATIADSLSPTFANLGEQSSTRTIREATSRLLPVASPVTVSEVDLIARQRVKLMALKYADPEGISAEISARLEILSARLAQRAPRVTDAQVELLERAAETLAAFSHRSDSRRNRLNMLARV